MSERPEPEARRQPIWRKPVLMVAVVAAVGGGLGVLAYAMGWWWECDGACAITQCTPQRPCLWKGKTYTAGNMCTLPNSICDEGNVWDCYCRDTLVKATNQPKCICRR